eukprot:EC689932.1.p1 GENE.EC689932.1~~EC689932.1.p1  ORF type:complete len:165 (-),score=11.49 EC689932.1:99-566(-)
MSAVFGVFCPRVGVPLIDGGTVRLPRIVGLGNAMHMILTGRAVDSLEALAMGLVNRAFPTREELLSGAQSLGLTLARFPQQCLRADRRSARLHHSLPEKVALLQEFAGGMEVIEGGESSAGAQKFSEGKPFRHATPKEANPGSLPPKEVPLLPKL